jgi:DNA-binding phage protein
MKNKFSGELSVWKSSEFLKTEEDIENYWEACQEEGNQELITNATQVIKRALNELPSLRTVI